MGHVLGSYCYKMLYNKVSLNSVVLNITYSYKYAGLLGFAGQLSGFPVSLAGAWAREGVVAMLHTCSSGAWAEAVQIPRGRTSYSNGRSPRQPGLLRFGRDWTEKVTWPGPPSTGRGNPLCMMRSWRGCECREGKTGASRPAPHRVTSVGHLPPAIYLHWSVTSTFSSFSSRLL